MLAGKENEDDEKDDEEDDDEHEDKDQVCPCLCSHDCFLMLTYLCPHVYLLVSSCLLERRMKSTSALKKKKRQRKRTERPDAQQRQDAQRKRLFFDMHVSLGFNNCVLMLFKERPYAVIRVSLCCQTCMSSCSYSFVHMLNNLCPHACWKGERRRRERRRRR